MNNRPEPRTKPNKKDILKEDAIWNIDNSVSSTLRRVLSRPIVTYSKRPLRNKIKKQSESLKKQAILEVPDSKSNTESQKVFRSKTQVHTEENKQVPVILKKDKGKGRALEPKIQVRAATKLCLSKKKNPIVVEKSSSTICVQRNESQQTNFPFGDCSHSPIHRKNDGILQISGAIQGGSTRNLKTNNVLLSSDDPLLGKLTQERKSLSNERFVHSEVEQNISVLQKEGQETAAETGGDNRLQKDLPHQKY